LQHKKEVKQKSAMQKKMIATQKMTVMQKKAKQESVMQIKIITT